MRRSRLSNPISLWWSPTGSICAGAGAVFRAGCLNIHGSCCPPGAVRTIQRAIPPAMPRLADHNAADAGLDTGPVLLTAAASHWQHDTAGDLHDALTNLAPRLSWKPSRGCCRAGSRPTAAIRGRDSRGQDREGRGAARLGRGRPATHRKVRAFTPGPRRDTLRRRNAARAARAGRGRGPMASPQRRGTLLGIADDGLRGPAARLLAGRELQRSGTPGRGARFRQRGSPRRHPVRNMKRAARGARRTQPA